MTNASAPRHSQGAPALGHSRQMWVLSLPLVLPISALQAGRTLLRAPRLGAPTDDRAGVCYGRHPEGLEPALSLVVVGESTAASVGVATHRNGLAATLAEGLSERVERPIRWTTVGKIGATVARMERSLVKHVPRDADLIVVLAGVNDTFTLTSERRWNKGVRDLRESLMATGAKRVLFSEVPPVGAFPGLPQPLRWQLGLRAQVLNDALRRTLGEEETAGVRFQPDLSYCAPDGLHPSEAGYAAWSEQLLARCLERLTG